MRRDLLNSKFGSQRYLFSGKREYTFKSKELHTQCEGTESAWEGRPVRMEHSQEETSWIQKPVWDTFMNHGKSQELIPASQAMMLSRNTMCLKCWTCACLLLYVSLNEINMPLTSQPIIFNVLNSKSKGVLNGTGHFSFYFVVLWVIKEFWVSECFFNITTFQQVNTGACWLHFSSSLDKPILVEVPFLSRTAQ